MKRILLALIISAPICAMQPEQKTQINKNVQYIATGVSIYNAIKPIDIMDTTVANIVMTKPTLWPLVGASAAVYFGTKFAIDTYQKRYTNQQNNNQQ